MYVYKFLDAWGKILYIGKTTDMKRRMSQHFTNGHLDGKCYNTTKRIKYITLKTEADMNLTEIYLINKYKPKYNKALVYDGKVTLKVNHPIFWRTHKIDLTENRLKKIENQISEIANVPDKRANDKVIRLYPTHNDLVDNAIDLAVSKGVISISMISREIVNNNKRKAKKIFEEVTQRIKCVEQGKNNLPHKVLTTREDWEKQRRRNH